MEKQKTTNYKSVPQKNKNGRWDNVLSWLRTQNLKGMTASDIAKLGLKQFNLDSGCLSALRQQIYIHKLSDPTLKNGNSKEVGQPKIRKYEKQDINFITKIAKGRDASESYLELKKLIPGVFKTYKNYYDFLVLHKIPFKKYTDFIDNFLESNTIIANKFFSNQVTKKELYETYETWSKVHNLKVVTNILFGRYVNQLYNEKLEQQNKDSVQLKLKDNTHLKQLTTETINPQVMYDFEQNLLLQQDKETTRDIKLQEIQNEIDEISNRKFDQLDCNLEQKYNTDDYIKMLEMLIYLSENNSEIKRMRDGQHNIMNSYHSDVVHEIEHVQSEDGDTYLQDKLKLLRNKRRYYEYDLKDNTVLEKLWKNFTIIEAKKTLNSLNQLRKSRELGAYIPEVDTTMVKKYEWALPR